MAAITIASTDQYVFKRNFNENRWQSVVPSGKTCRVQVSKKNDVFYFRVTMEGGARIEHRLSKENRLHLSEGFIQVPLADDIELYGVKFTNEADAEIFYAKIVNEMNIPWSNQKTSVGADDLPVPFRPQSQPQSVQVVRTVPAAPLHQAPQTMDPNPRPRMVQYPPSMQQQPQPVVQQQNPGNQFNQQDQYSTQGQYNPQRAAGFNQQDFPYQQQNHQPQSHFPPEQPVKQKPNQYNVGVGGGQGMNVGMGGMQGPHSQGLNMQQGGQGMNMQQGSQMQQGGQGVNMQHGGQMQQGGQGMNMQHGGQLQQGGQGMNMQHGGQLQQGGQGMNMQHGSQLQQGGQGMNMQHGSQLQQGGQGMNMQHGGRMQQGGQGMNFQQGGRAMNVGMGGVHVQQPTPTPRNPSPRPPPREQPPKASDMSTVASSLMGALNRGDKDSAVFMVNAIISAMTDSSEKGKIGQLQVSFDKSAEPQPKGKQFVLHVRIEFQQPQKKPLDIYLEEVTAGMNVMELQYMVEKKFYIPRAAQNWIIGPKLVKNNEDLKKTLKDFDITGEGVDEVQVFMYVMHIKKAKVPKEEYEALRNRQQQRMQQNATVKEQLPPGQGQAQDQGQYQLPQRQPSYPQGQAQLPQRQASYPQGFPQPQDQQHAMNEPVYDQLGNRGYSGGVQQQQQQQQQQYLQQQQPDPTYSQLNVYQGGRPQDQLMNASPPQQGMMPQGNADPPLRARDAQVPPAQGNGAAQQPMPAEAFLGIPNQLQNPPKNDGVPNNAQQQPVPVPRSAVKPVGWSCPRCTFFNRPRRPGCEQCGHERPKDYVVPEDCPPEDFERQALENEKLFDEYEVKEKERKEKEAQENYRKLIEAEEAKLTTNKEAFDCAICFDNVQPGEGVILKGCVHQFCKGCLHDTVVNSEEVEIKCPFNDGEYTCGAVISEREIRAVCSEEEVKALHKRGLVQAESAAGNSFHCKTPNCEGFCFYEDDVNEFGCPVCHKANCLLCKAIHEGMNCQEYQDDIKRRAANDEAAQATQKMLDDLVRNGEAMNCPACKIVVQKKEGCDWIRCSMCKTEICWATKGPRWGPNGKGDTSGGCKCRVGGKKCTPLCRNCH